MAALRTGSVSAGPLLRHGNTSHLHAWGSDAVVKVLKPGIPPEWARREFTTTRLVRAAGLPAPEVLDLVDVDGRPGVVFRKVDGPSLLERAVERPEQLGACARELAALQRQITCLPAPAGLPDLAQRLGQQLAAVVALEPRERATIRTRLDALPVGTGVCHFDLHPNNILLGPDGPVVIDWFDAACGDVGADVARSTVLMRPELGCGHLDDAPDGLVAQFRTAYLAEVPAGSAEAWRTIVLAARTREPVEAEAQDALVREVRQLLALG